jgi:hypothetical protein
MQNAIFKYPIGTSHFQKKNRQTQIDLFLSTASLSHARRVSIAVVNGVQGILCRYCLSRFCLVRLFGLCLSVSLCLSVCLYVCLSYPCLSLPCVCVVGLQFARDVSRITPRDSGSDHVRIRFRVRVRVRVGVKARVRVMVRGWG